MRIFKTVTVVLLVVWIAVGAIELKSSDQVGIYAIVDKVVVENSDKVPPRIQIWGVFSITEGKPGDLYQTPQRGYLYFTLPLGKEDVTMKEWADLKSVAGTGQGVGFGAKYSLKVRLRKADEKPDAPDAYPLGMGITKVPATSSMIEPLKEMLKKPR